MVKRVNVFQVDVPYIKHREYMPQISVAYLSVGILKEVRFAMIMYLLKLKSLVLREKNIKFGVSSYIEAIHHMSNQVT